MTSVLDTLRLHCEQIVSALLEPAQFLDDPSKRIYWVYLLVSVLIAGLVFAYRYRGAWLKRLYHDLLSHRIWLHPSSLLDVKLMLAKSLVRAFLFASWIISSYGVAIAVAQFTTEQFGPTTATSLSDWTVTALYTLALFLSSDFSRYFVHRLCHQVPLLWQFHQVHHSAEVMTPLTLYRSHPVENLIFILRGVVVTGLVTGVFFYLFGTRAVQVQILGVNALGLLFSMFGANLRHSHVWISYGSALEHLFISPAQHQLHHSNHPRHHGANYGSYLAIWDWMGGSLHVAQGQQDVHFGLSDTELNHDPRDLSSALLGPFQGCWLLVSQRIRRCRSTERVQCD